MSLKVVVAPSPALSFTVRVIFADPVTPDIGLTTTVRAAPIPPRTILATGTSVVLLEVAVTTSEAAGVKSSATVKFSTDGISPSAIVWFAIDVIVGCPFTVSEKLIGVDSPPPFITVSVMVVMPLWPVTGVRVTVRDAPVPPNVIPVLGSNVVLLETPVTVNEAAGVMESPTVKGIAEVATVPTFIDLLVIVVMVGAE